MSQTRSETDVAALLDPLTDLQHARSPSPAAAGAIRTNTCGRARSQRARRARSSATGTAPLASASNRSRMMFSPGQPLISCDLLERERDLRATAWSSSSPSSGGWRRQTAGRARRAAAHRRRPVRRQAPPRSCSASAGPRLRRPAGRTSGSSAGAPPSPHVARRHGTRVSRGQLEAVGLRVRAGTAQLSHRADGARPR